MPGRRGPRPDPQHSAHRCALSALAAARLPSCHKQVLESGAGFCPCVLPCQRVSSAPPASHPLPPTCYLLASGRLRLCPCTFIYTVKKELSSHVSGPMLRIPTRTGRCPGRRRGRHAGGNHAPLRNPSHCNPHTRQPSSSATTVPACSSLPHIHGHHPLRPLQFLQARPAALRAAPSCRPHSAPPSPALAPLLNAPSLAARPRLHASCSINRAAPTQHPQHTPFPSLPRHCLACSLLASPSAQACPMQRHPAASTRCAAQRQSWLLPPAASLPLPAPERLVQSHPAASRAVHLRNAHAHAVQLSSQAAVCEGRVRARQPGQGRGARPGALATGLSAGVAPKMAFTRRRRLMVSEVATAVFVLFGQQPFVVGNSPGSSRLLAQQRP